MTHYCYSPYSYIKRLPSSQHARCAARNVVHDVLDSVLHLCRGTTGQGHVRVVITKQLRKSGITMLTLCRGVARATTDKR